MSNSDQDQHFGPGGCAPWADDDQVAAALSGWLTTQRWFAHQGDSPSIAIHTRLPVMSADGVTAELVIVEVAKPEGAAAIERELYQVLVGWRSELPEQLRHVSIGTIAEKTMYDAIYDTAVTELLHRVLITGTPAGAIHGDPVMPASTTPATPGRVLHVEQSNTSVLYNEDIIVKQYRRIHLGINPEVDSLRALGTDSAVPSPSLISQLTATIADTETTLAVATSYFTNAADGWALATASVRDLIATDDVPADEVGGDFAAEAHRLGETVAAIHQRLSHTLGTVPADVPTSMACLEADAIRIAAVTPALAPYLDAIVARYQAAPQEALDLPWQQIHGDLHLGQTLRNVTGWVLIDFEGEPLRSPEVRRQRDSPLKDIAGMLRSFDYAAQQPTVLGVDHTQRNYRAHQWSIRNSDAFLTGYAGVSGVDPREFLDLLTAYQIAKAVYEVGYEHKFRPLWEHIPLGAIAELTAA